MTPQNRTLKQTDIGRMSSDLVMKRWKHDGKYAFQAKQQDRKQAFKTAQNKFPEATSDRKQVTGEIYGEKH